MLTPVLGNSIRDRTRPIGTGSLTRFDWFKILSPSNEYSFPKRKYIGDAVFPALNSLYNISGEASINFTTDIAFTTKYMASFDPAIIEFNTGGTVLSGSFSTSTDETSFSFNSTAELTKIYAPNLDPASFTFSSTAAAHEVFNIIDAIASFEVISDFSGMAEIYQLTTDATAVDFGLSVGSPAMAIVPTRFLTRRTDTGDPYGKLITISDISDIDIIMDGTALLVDGSNEMSAPINSVPGSLVDLSLRNKDETDTGLYFPGADQLAVALGGIRKFLFETDGVSLLIGTFSGKLIHNNTADQEYELPDISGRILVGRTTSTGTNMTISVSTTAVQLLDTNIDRIGGVFTNNGEDDDIYIGFSSSVVVGTTANANGGMRITSGGGNFSLDQLAGYSGEIWAITSSGSTIVSVLEW